MNNSKKIPLFAFLFFSICSSASCDEEIGELQGNVENRMPFLLTLTKIINSHKTGSQIKIDMGEQALERENVQGMVYRAIESLLDEVLQELTGFIRVPSPAKTIFKRAEKVRDLPEHFFNFTYGEGKSSLIAHIDLDQLPIDEEDRSLEGGKTMMTGVDLRFSVDKKGDVKENKLPRAIVSFEKVQDD